MSNVAMNSFLELLDVHLDAFAMCTVADGFGLRVEPFPTVIVHYVLQGEGSIECAYGDFPIRQGCIAVIPKMLPKQINGAGAITKIVDAEVTCPLSPGLVEFRAYAQDSGQDCLILGCAAVAVTCGHELEFFRDLRRPLVECVGGDGQSPALFANMLAELTGASIGTKAMVNTMMKQLLILLLRNHVERDGLQSSFCANLLNPRLSKALMIMLSRPQDHHCLDELAQTAGLSRSRFVQQFTEAYGTSPMDYLQSVRIRAGAKLLRQSSLPVKSIAGAVGFASRSHFSRAFRARLGVDPTAFRDAIDAPVDVELD